MTPTPQCVACGDPVSRVQRKYCPKPACKAVQRHVSWVTWRDRAKQGLARPRKTEHQYPRDPTPRPKSFSWWAAQAARVEETCGRCKGPMAGVYVPPSRETVNECAVVAHCRMCGTERMVLAGFAGVPYTKKGVKAQRDLEAERSRRWSKRE